MIYVKFLPNKLTHKQDILKKLLAPWRGPRTEAKTFWISNWQIKTLCRELVLNIILPT